MARIYISTDPSGRVIVSFPYDPSLVEKLNPLKVADGILKKNIGVFLPHSTLPIERGERRRGEEVRIACLSTGDFPRSLHEGTG